MKNSSLLPAAQIKLRDHESGSLRLYLDGQAVELDVPRRALPVSDPDRFIVLSDLDGQKVGVIGDINDLDPESQDVLAEALACAYAVQIITRILKVEREPMTGQSCWQVEVLTEKPVRQTVIPARGLNSQVWHDDSSRAKRRSKVLQARILWHRRRRLYRRMAAAHKVASQMMAATSRPHEFTIAGPEDIQTARYPRIYIVDVEGNRYEIPDVEALDLESRQATERFF